MGVYIYNGETHEFPVEFVEEKYITKYKGEIKDRKTLKLVPYINTFGGAAVKITGWLITIFGFGIYMGSIFLEQISWFLVLLGFVVGFLFFTEGFSLIYSVQYVKATKCKNCLKNYAYEEREKPNVKEVSTEDSYIVTITRYWKCKHCGHMDSSEGPERIKTHKGTKYKPEKIKCEKCGKTEITAECRDPDVREEITSMSTVGTTIRYYRCRNCGHLNRKELEWSESS